MVDAWDAALSARSVASAVIVCVPSFNSCRSSAGIVIETLLLLIDPVYVLLFRPSVSVCPLSIPVVDTVTVPSLLSSVAFKWVPQLKDIEFIVAVIS